ncbi:hypothetical protein EVAR_26936_1 [Eumeta japonica]|uniref:Uncharacterized protein n=1 Tax=Eumeta variegata TaxID=151549 RepID=A0A4C1VV92_EUMVA|nr:hypothetical protein EVAR_26936_1 [Eumeta japonica]
MALSRGNVRGLQKIDALALIQLPRRILAGLRAAVLRGPVAAVYLSAPGVVDTRGSGPSDTWLSAVRVLL